MIGVFSEYSSGQKVPINYSEVSSGSSFYLARSIFSSRRFTVENILVLYCESYTGNVISIAFKAYHTVSLRVFRELFILICVVTSILRYYILLYIF